MNESPTLNALVLLLWLASLIHVGIQSVKYKRVGRPFWHIMIVGLVLWPVGYLLWVFYWPGILRKSKAQLRAEDWVESVFRRKR